MKKILHNAWGSDSLFSVGVPWLAHLHHAGQNLHRNRTWRQGSHGSDHPGPPKPSLIWSWLALADPTAEPNQERFPPKCPEGTDYLRLPPVSHCTQHVNRQQAGGEEDWYLAHTVPSPVTPGPPSGGPKQNIHHEDGQDKDEGRTAFDLVAADFL